MASNLQLTLSIFKPHIAKFPFATESIKQIIVENDLNIVRHAQKYLTKATADEFYEEHRRKFFYNRLQTFMCRWVNIKRVWKYYAKILI